MKRVFFTLLLLLEVIEVSPILAAVTSGWESEKVLVKLKAGDKWPISSYYYALPSLAYNLRNDGKWFLVCNTEANSKFFGYYWDEGKNEWVSDDSLVKGLNIRQYGYSYWAEYPAFADNLTGDSKWTLITHSDAFYAYYWDGGQWLEDSSRVKGLPTDIGTRTTHTFINDLKGDGKWTLISGATSGLFRAFYWDGSQWVEDSTRVNGLPSTGLFGRISNGFNVFGDNQWNVVLGDWNTTSLRVFFWNGTKWVEDTIKAAGLNIGTPRLVPTLGYNFRGDGKWMLISGVGIYDTLLGFYYNTTDSSLMPYPTNIASEHPLATSVRIKFSYPYTWNHRIKYSTNQDLSNAVWSKWFEDLDNVELKLEGLNPATTYYYEVYTYIPWDTNDYVQSSLNSFVTTPAQNIVVVNPGEPIQDAIENLPLVGGTIELAAGIHDINNTIVINRGNITIQGTQDSVIRVNDREKPAFVIPHENPSPNEPWTTMPIVENLTFKGFKVNSSYAGFRGDTLINAWQVNNLTVENLLDESFLSHILSVNLIGGSSIARSSNIFVRNNNLFQSAIGFCTSTNVYITGNTITKASSIAGIDINSGNEYVYISSNTIYGGTNMNIRGHGGNYVFIENNELLGGTQRCIWIDGLSNVTISNNILTGTQWAAIHIQPQAPRIGVKILNNLIYNNQNRGIWTTQYDHGFQEKNSDIEVVNNVIAYNGGDAIQMETKWAQFKKISNNIISNNGGYGINYIETVEPTIIKYNDVWNNALGNYQGTLVGIGDISADPLFADSLTVDFHLKSQYGRWNGTGWVNDAVASPGINAGDPADDYSNEPQPNGGRINMGAYGNTPEASKSSIVPPPPPLEDLPKVNNIKVYPNPYVKGKSLMEKITFANLPKETTIRIYAVSGELVKTIEHQDGGDGGSEEWDVSNVSNGIYLYVITSSEGVKKGKVSVIK